uniref:Uncharacterized protein n=1 Tax=Arundo donax TaxID=35708 RepID=A0A0A9FVE4_ARUDO
MMALFSAGFVAIHCSWQIKGVIQITIAVQRPITVRVVFLYNIS